MAYGSHDAIAGQLVVFILRISAFFADVESAEMDQPKTDFLAARLFNNIFLGSFVHCFFGYGVGISHMKIGKMIVERKKNDAKPLYVFLDIQYS